MKDQITQIALDTMIGIRNAVSEVRKSEFASYIKNLIEAKNGGLDVSMLPMPLLSDRVQQGLEAALSARSTGGASGGVTWTIVELAGNFAKDTQQGIKIKVDMEFMSMGAPSLARMQELSVEELKKLLEVVEVDS